MDREKISQALHLMQKGYDILKNADQESVRKSAYFLRGAIKRIKDA